MVWRSGFYSKVWLSFFLIAFAVLSTPLRADGVRSNLDETVLFRWVSVEDRYAQASASEIQPKNLYLRWDNSEQRYVWVTGDNRHLILSKSKVQGARIGYTGSNAKNWFEYNELDLPAWKKSTQRILPEMWRWDPARVVGGSWTTGTYVSERAPANWETWGGELDPIVPPVVDPPKPPVVDPPVVKPPSNELGCTIEGPSSAVNGSTVILTMKTTGPVKSAQLNGAAVDFPVVMRSWVAGLGEGAPIGNLVTIAGSVRGQRANELADCKLVIKITN